MLPSAAGYSGVTCQTNIDECASAPCVNGVCADAVDVYICTCTAGWSGANCAVDVDECASLPCQNGVELLPHSPDPALNTACGAGY
jgi:hypothetical protein